jgi:hypothetical protein
LETVKGRDHLEDLGVDGKIINTRMDLGETGLEGVDWMHLAQDKGHLWAVVNTIMNLRFP